MGRTTRAGARVTTDSAEWTGPPRRILLVGFMASGKSAIGRALARELDWRFVDFDREIARRGNRPTHELVRELGEPAFRELEGEVGAKLLALDGVVLATGGGWPCRPGRLDALPEGTLSIWIQVSVETTIRRAARRPGTRPLLDVEDPEARARELLAEREPWYGLAHWRFSGDRGSPRAIAERIVSRLGDIQ